MVYELEPVSRLEAEVSIGATTAGRGANTVIWIIIVTAKPTATANANIIGIGILFKLRGILKNECNI
jgi:hypothetical protein